jgi:hypothetical protein
MNEIINKNMNEKLSDKVYDVYITYLQSLRKNEADVLKFLITLLGSIGGFIYMILKEGIDSLKQNYGLLLITASGATVLIFWGVLYTFAMSYTHRYLQALLYRYEKEYKKELGLLNFPHWNSREKFRDFSFKDIIWLEIAPSNYKAHLFAFALALLFIWMVTLILITLIPWIILLIYLIFCIFNIFWIINFHYINQLWKKLDP